MRRAILLTLLLPMLLGQAPGGKGDEPDRTKGDPAAKAKRERLHALYLSEAEGYTIYRDASRKEKVELRREPVYVWTNIVRG